VIHGLIYQSQCTSRVEPITVMKTAVPLKNEQNQHLVCEFIGQANEEQKAALANVVGLLNKELVRFFKPTSPIMLRLKWRTLQASEISGQSAQLTLALAIVQYLIRESLLIGSFVSFDEQMSLVACTGELDSYGNVKKVDSIIEKLEAALNYKSERKLCLFIPKEQLKLVNESLDTKLHNKAANIIGVSSLTDLLDKAFTLNSQRNQLRAWFNQTINRRVVKGLALCGFVFITYFIYVFIANLQYQIKVEQAQKALASNDFRTLKTHFNCFEKSCIQALQLPQDFKTKLSEAVPQALSNDNNTANFSGASQAYPYFNGVAISVNNEIAYLSDNNETRPLLNIPLPWSDRMINGSLCAKQNADMKYAQLRYLTHGGFMVEVSPLSTLVSERRPLIEHMAPEDNAFEFTRYTSAKSHDCQSWLLTSENDSGEVKLSLYNAKQPSTQYHYIDNVYGNQLNVLVSSVNKVKPLKISAGNRERMAIFNNQIMCLIDAAKGSNIVKLNQYEIEQYVSCSESKHFIAKLNQHFHQFGSLKAGQMGGSIAITMQTDSQKVFYPLINLTGG